MGATGFYGVTGKLNVINKLGPNAGANVPADTHAADTHDIWLDQGNLSSSPLPTGELRWDLILPTIFP